jgi:hypothetical protein
MDHANFVTDHGGSILWLSTDLRRAFGRDGSGSASPSVVGSPTSQARRHSTSCDAFLVSSDGPPVLTQRFKSALYSLSESGRYGTARPIVMTINAGAMCRAACPGNQRTPESSLGLSADEILDMTLIAGANSNVRRPLIVYFTDSFIEFLSRNFHPLCTTTIVLITSLVIYARSWLWTCAASSLRSKRIVPRGSSLIFCIASSLEWLLDTRPVTLRQYQRQCHYRCRWSRR